MADYDLIVHGGTIIDGTRFPRFTADIGVRAGRIARIGNLTRDQADRRIDATGASSPQALSTVTRISTGRSFGILAVHRPNKMASRR